MALSGQPPFARRFRVSRGPGLVTYRAFRLGEISVSWIAEVGTSEEVLASNSEPSTACKLLCATSRMLAYRLPVKSEHRLPVMHPVLCCCYKGARCAMTRKKLPTHRHPPKRIISPTMLLKQKSELALSAPGVFLLRKVN